jgi:asparagine synthase (glutamine-hydrolysing)
VPGIVGLITKLPRAEAELQLKKMLKAMWHENFYSSGVSIDESLGLFVGWTALKGSFCDGMPLCNNRRDVCLVFSGEDYSEQRALRGHENGNGNRSSESSYLIRAYERNPADFIPSLNGMFHGLIADRRSAEVMLFNDRYSMHRLCYHGSKDAFYFAAESKAILAVRPELAEIDYKGLGEFASFSCVLEDRTIFKNIAVVPGGSIWKFRNRELRSKSTYFTPQEWEQQPALDPDSYYEKLRSTLATRLPQYFIGKQPMGIALTGGFDTRVILAMHSPAPGSLPSYTFGGPMRESQDVLVGRKVAKICGQTHKVIQVGDEFLESFAEYANRTVSLTEGTVDVSRGDLYVSQKAREIAPAKIVGTYGSEIVRQAVMFKPVPPAAGLLSPDFVPYVREAASTYTSVRAQHPVTFAAFRQSPWYHHGVLALEKSQLTVHSPFLDNDFVRTVYRAPEGDAANRDIRLQLIMGANPALGRVRSDRGLRANGGRFLTAPMHAFQEFTFKAEYAYDYGMPQPVARVDHYFSAFRLERLFLGRHKFLHFRVWYRDQLANYIRQMLLDPLALSRPYIQKKTMESMVARHLSGDRNYTTEIHRVLTMELLHRIFMNR